MRGGGGGEPEEERQRRYEGILDCLATVRRVEGLAGLFAGWVPRVLFNGVILSFFTPLRRDGYLRIREALLIGGTFFNPDGPL